MTSGLLNWREIDAVLAEWPAGESWLRRVRQPDFRRIILEFSGREETWAVVVVLSPPYPRIHRANPSERLPKALPKPPRFTAVLKSRLEGARLKSFRQLGRDRIVRFRFEKGGTASCLDAKLWGNGANLILSDAEGHIIDAFSRRPKRREIPGEAWPPEGIGDKVPGESPFEEKSAGTGNGAEESVTGRFPGSTRSDQVVGSPRSAAEEPYSLRDLPGEGDWNRRLESYFAALESDADRNGRLRLWESHLNRREAALDSRERDIAGKETRCLKDIEAGRWADLLMANLYGIPDGADAFETEDWERPGDTVRIPLVPSLDPRENAERYYARRKKATRGLKRLEEDRRALEHARSSVEELKRRLGSGETDGPPFDADPPDAKSRSGKTGEKGPGLPGLWIRKEGHIMVVGRSAKESDAILRRWAKGNDLWLHARDYPGGHVFVRSPRDKSVPLDLLLDAGNLALSYSKAKASGEADLYYTRVKNLRRPKGGKTGTVLPTQEKNLRVKLDPARLAALKALSETG